MRWIFLLLLCFSKLQAFSWETGTHMGEKVRATLFDEFVRRVQPQDRVLFLGIEDLPEQISSCCRESVFGYSQLEHQNAFDMICAYQPYLKELEKIRNALKPGGICIIIYQPLESHHWEKCVGKYQLALLSPNVSAKDFSNEVKFHQFVFLDSSVERDVAHYKNQEELFNEIRRDPRVWGIRQAYTEEAKSLADRIFFLSNHKKEKSVLIGYKLFVYILLKRI